MVKWPKLFKRIPDSVQISRNTKYEVLWSDNFNGKELLGETRFNEKQIVLKSGESQRETVHTYCHELLHAISDDYEVGLTEAQVRALEKALYYVLKPGNVFKSGGKR